MTLVSSSRWKNSVASHLGGGVDEDVDRPAEPGRRLGHRGAHLLVVRGSARAPIKRRPLAADNSCAAAASTSGSRASSATPRPSLRALPLVRRAFDATNSMRGPPPQTNGSRRAAARSIRQPGSLHRLLLYAEPAVVA
ncbi:MAG: hypothetical protein ABI696_16470, partial [Rubrivivax sp.]